MIYEFPDAVRQLFHSSYKKEISEVRGIIESNDLPYFIYEKESKGLSKDKGNMNVMLRKTNEKQLTNEDISALIYYIPYKMSIHIWDTTLMDITIHVDENKNIVGCKPAEICDELKIIPKH